jgi:hypothetical protein
MVTRSLLCPSCGGHLDGPGRTGEPLKCGYCGATAVVIDGATRSLQSYRLPAQPTSDLEQQLRPMLSRMGLDAPQALSGEVTWDAYLARVARHERTATNTYYLSGGWWTQAGKGTLGVPLEEGAREEILYLPADAPLEPDPEGLSAGVAPDLENFEGRVKVWIERKLSSSDDAFLFWEGDHRIVSVPTTTFTFVHPVQDAGKVRWRSRTPDDRYEVVFDGHSGKMVRSRLPRRVVKSLKPWLVGGAVLAVVLLLALATVAIGLLPLLIGFVAAVAGVVLG